MQSTIPQKPFKHEVALPVIGQGTWEMEHDDDPAKAIRVGIEHGLTHIDTAEMYGSGRVEAMLGKALRGCRDQTYLVSKVLPFNASRHGTIAACERSLRHLRTDYLDLYLLHWPGSEPLEETVAAFEQLQTDGKIRAWGVSNFDVDDLEKLLTVAPATEVACNQVLYHPGERTIETRVLPFCTHHDIPVVAYSPVGHGSLMRSAGKRGADTLARIAQARGVSVYQVALQFVICHNNVFAIPKASRVEHVLDNAAAAGWTLSQDEVDALEAALPAPSRGHLPML